MPPWLFQARSFFPACFRVSSAILGGGSPQISRIYRSITALQKGVQTPPFFHDFGHFWPPPNFDFREKPHPPIFCKKNSSSDEKYFSWSTISFSLSINKNIFASIDGCEENSSQLTTFCLKSLWLGGGRSRFKMWRWIIDHFKWSDWWFRNTSLKDRRSPEDKSQFSFNFSQVSTPPRKKIACHYL